LRNDVEKFGDDVEDQDPSHPRWVDFPTVQSYELSSLKIHKETSLYDVPSAIHPGVDAVASEHADCRPSCPSPSCASLLACARTVCCPFLIPFDVKKINGARRKCQSITLVDKPVQITTGLFFKFTSVREAMT